MRSVTLGWLGLACLAAAGCQTHHYVVREAETPVYASPHGDDVVATLPRYHHAPLPDDPDERGRIRVEVDGHSGYLDRGDVALIAYRDPDWDDGRERSSVLNRTLRELRVDHQGDDWAPEIAQAVRDGRVEPGMTREQVETAWGWPVDVQPTQAGGERWVYRQHRPETVSVTSTECRPSWRFTYWANVWGDRPRGPWRYGRSSLRWRAATWTDCDTPGWRWRTSPLWTYDWTWHGDTAQARVRLPVVVEYTVEFSPQGIVQSTQTRRYLEP